MKPILVHIHVYYQELLAELLDIVAELQDVTCEVWATYPESKPELEAALSGCAHSMPVMNRGYDIAPFLQVLNSVNLANYSYVLKLHTKRDMPGDAYLYPLPYNYGGPRWREYLLNVARRENMQLSLSAFAQDDTLGMVADHRLIRRSQEKRFKSSLDQWLGKVGLTCRGCSYVMGSMFLCRAELLKPLQNLGLQPSDFPLPDDDHTENLAHIMERFLGGSVVAQGYRIADVFTPGWKQSRWMYWLRRLQMLLYFRKTKADGGCIVKVCKIPVYRKKSTLRKK